MALEIDVDTLRIDALREEVRRLDAKVDAMRGERSP
jgi:hypothetical protein